MVSTGLSRAITQPVAGLSLFAFIAVACPSPTWAQVPSTDAVSPAPSPAPVNAQPVPPRDKASQELQLNRGVPPATAQPVQAPSDYTLGGGDRIRVTVLDVPEYNGEYQIPPGGRVYVPLIGSVSVLGLTQAQAAEALTARYARFLKRPLVTVSLLSPRPINVVVAGEVNRPGSFTVALQGGAGTDPGVQYPTVIGAITQADGVTLAADITQVQLRRRTGAGQQQVSNVDLRRLVKTGNLGQDITLRDGDEIFVPTSTTPNLAELRQFSTANFAQPLNSPRTITVVGEVNRPGPYVVVGGATSSNTQLSQGGTITTQENNNSSGFPTVTRAIQLAGGITALADVRNVQIHRMTKTGAEENINVNLWKVLQNGDVTQDTIVQDGDSIIIPKGNNVTPAEQTQLALTNFSPATIQVTVVGEVKNPGLVRIPPNTPLNQALLDAGGFTNSRAVTSHVEMIRLNPNGTVTKRRVNIKFENGINEKTNPVLRNNDIVFVHRNTIARVGDTVGTILSPIVGVLGLYSIFR